MGSYGNMSNDELDRVFKKIGLPKSDAQKLDVWMDLVMNDGVSIDEFLLLTLREHRVPDHPSDGHGIGRAKMEPPKEENKDPEDALEGYETHEFLLRMTKKDWKEFQE